MTLRRAPTVAREWGVSDALLYNLMTMNLAVMFTIPLLVALAFFPAGSLPVAILIAGLFCCAEAAVYAFLASSMPRSGGDYYFQSRLISPAAGTVFVFTAVVLGGALWMAIAGWFAARVAVGPLLYVLGSLSGSSGLLDAAAFVQSGPGVLVMSLLVIVWSAVVNYWGMRIYALLQRACWLIGGAALAVAALLAAALGSDAVGDGAPYREAFGVARALGLGAAPGPGTVASTLWLVPVAAFSLIYPAWSVQQAGEVRRADSLRAQTIVILGAEAVTVVLSAGVLALVLALVDRRALAAAAYLFFEAPESMPVPTLPFFWYFLDGRWPGAVVALALCALFNAWFWMWVPDVTLAATRVLESMSSDRSLPRVLGRLRGRRRAPVHAILFFSAVCVVPALLFAFSDLWRLTLSVTLLNVPAFAATCGAAAALPFVDRELYRESTAAPFELFGVPLLTWCGAAFVLFTAFLAWRFVADDALALGLDRWVLPVSIGGAYAVSAVLYRVVRRLRRGQEGQELEIVYRPITGDR
jgi:amino acid transporter